MSIGEKIKQLRKLRGFTQQQLADCMGTGITRSAIAQWETGDVKGNLKPENFITCSRCLGVTPESLIYDDNIQPILSLYSALSAFEKKQFLIKALQEL